MGIALHKLEQLRAAGMLPAGGRVLDIGSSNLYQAEPGALDVFIRNFQGAAERPDHDSFVARLARGSAYGPNGGLNESFVGELLERVGMSYTSFDIASGYSTEIFDLNVGALRPALRGAFDTVLNFGTTEHLLNQLNAFKVILEATKVGGHMVHELPAIGYVDHCYVTYTARFFFDIASYNDCELMKLEFRGPGKGPELLKSLREHRQYFPALEHTLGDPAQAEIEKVPIPDIAIYAVLRKRSDAPFRGPLEVSTSVGQIGVSASAEGIESQIAGMQRELEQLGSKLAELETVTTANLAQLEATTAGALARIEEVVRRRRGLRKVAYEIMRPFRQLRARASKS